MGVTNIETEYLGIVTKIEPAYLVVIKIESEYLVVTKIEPEYLGCY